MASENNAQSWKSRREVSNFVETNQFLFHPSTEQSNWDVILSTDTSIEMYRRPNKVHHMLCTCLFLFFLEQGSLIFYKRKKQRLTYWFHWLEGDKNLFAHPVHGHRGSRAKDAVVAKCKGVLSTGLWTPCIQCIHSTQDIASAARNASWIQRSWFFIPTINSNIKMMVLCL